MAVFMINICKFNGCGITFPNLGDLIQHIEDTHIDYDPLIIEQKEASQPSCLPLSYVLRFFTEASRRENACLTQDVKRRLASVVKPSSVRSGTPTGSEFDDEDMLSGHSEDSNDSWTNVEEFSSEFIMRYGSRNTSIGPNGQSNGAVEKPFACPVPGCKKRYKNVNGIKYHSKNGHKKDGKVRKGYKCHCGKSYKTAQGLKNHSIAQHFTTQSTSPVTTSLSATTPSLPPPQTSPSLKQVPMMKTLQGLVVQTSSNHLTSVNHQRQVTQVIDTTHLDSNKVIRAVFENASNKLTKDGTITTLTIPRSSVANLQISQNALSLMQHLKGDSESTWNIHQIISSKSNGSSSQTFTLSNENELGVLTPASSPRCSPNGKIKQIIDEAQQTPHPKIVSVNVESMPKKAATPLSSIDIHADISSNIATQ